MNIVYNTTHVEDGIYRVYFDGTDEIGPIDLHEVNNIARAISKPPPGDNWCLDFFTFATKDGDINFGANDRFILALMPEAGWLYKTILAQVDMDGNTGYTFHPSYRPLVLLPGDRVIPLISNFGVGNFSGVDFAGVISYVKRS